MPLRQILIDKAYSVSDETISVHHSVFFFPIGRHSSAWRDHVLIAEHYEMPLFAVFFAGEEK